MLQTLNQDISKDGILPGDTDLYHTGKVPGRFSFTPKRGRWVRGGSWATVVSEERKRPTRVDEGPDVIVDMGVWMEREGNTPGCHEGQ